MDEWPKRIIVGGVTYNIEYTPHRNKIDGESGDNCNLYGRVHHRKHYIRIWTGQDDEIQEPIEQFDTLLHELLHIAFAQNPAMANLLTKPDDEETFVSCLSRMLSDSLTRSQIVLLPKATPQT